MLLPKCAKLFEFQFLNGAIGVIQRTSNLIASSLFQFLNGAIGVFQNCSPLRIYCVFQFLNRAIGVVFSCIASSDKKNI